jgi:hypothetical protein
MAQLGLGLGAQINGSNIFDPDALRYFTTAGVTDATGRSQINTFVRGIKSLGLYNNMVAWPLRSTQNAGTGTTAYSLGGFGVYNGTLTPTVGGPTWGTSGITFDGSTHYINTSLTNGFSEFSVFSVATPETVTTSAYEFAKDSISAPVVRDFAIRAYSAGSAAGVFVNPNPIELRGPAFQTTIRSLCLRGSSSVAKFRRNNESDFTTTTGVLTQTSAAIAIGSSSGPGFSAKFKGTISASILFNTDLTDAQTSAVYYLYQSTLGAGLGLPDQTFARDFATNKTLNHGTGPNISFVRASAANYFNSSGVLTSAAVNEPRFDHDPVTLESKGLLVEVARTNLLLNSASLSTQSVVVTAVPYTLSFYGTGTITLSGVSTAGPLVGSGAFPTRSTLTFTPTAGTLTLTVTGTVEYAQLEAGSFASSYITTAGASATRSSDLPSITPISSFYNQNEGTIFVQQSQAVISHTTSFRFLEISNSGSTFRKPGMEIETNNLAVFSTLGGSPKGVSVSSGPVSANTVYKIACAYASNNFRGALNGTLTSADTTVDVATPVVDRMSIGYATSIPSFQVSCHIQKVEYYPTRLTDARMQYLTTL